MEEVNQYVFEGEELHYWYSLDLLTSGPSSVRDTLITEVKAKIPPGTALQDPKSCTAQCAMIIIRVEIHSVKVNFSKSQTYA